MNPEREAARQFETQMKASEEQNDMAYMGSVAQAGQVQLDSQVSAMLLEVPRKFLKYKTDKYGAPVSAEKYGYVEPYMDESLAFLTREQVNLLNQIDNTLSLIYQFGNKHDNDMSSTFNQIVNVRSSMLNNSRTTGLSSKLAKSQTVHQTSEFKKFGQAPKPKKIFGIF